MKIALVVPGGVDRSGERRVIPALLALIERLARLHELHVFALHQEPLPGTWDLLGARIHNIGERRTRTRAVHAIRAEHRKSPFQLVHAIFSGSCGLIAVAAARMLGIPSTVHVTGGEPVRLPEIGYGGRLKWRGRLQEATVRAAANVITATSGPQLELLRALGAAARRVPLGVDLTRAWPGHEPVARAAGETARLIHVATLNRVKDQPMLLRALGRLAEMRVDFHAELVGEDLLGGSVQRLAGELGLQSRVRFRGFLTQPQLYPLMQAAHALVVSSRHEAGPFVMLEAAALGVPTVGTAVGHIAEWAPDAALAVPVGDAPALAAALQRVLSDEPLRLRLGYAAWRRARCEDADHTAENFAALYAELTHCGR
jgi:glycosyltransferase involved in cell wall biosynthesis